MRTKQETEQAAAILRQKGDRISLVQASVVEERRTESWVFTHYVQGVSEESKDEATFFAARDAARYVAGSIALEELIPDAEQYNMPPIKEKESSLSEGIIQKLIQRIDALEKRVKVLEDGQKSVFKTVIIDRPGDDHVTQANICKYIGCNKKTLQLWAKKGIVTRYLSGKNVYYRKSEIDRNEKIQMYMRKLQNSTEP